MKNRPAHECVSPVLTPTPSPYRQVRERGFERTTIAQIADAAEISRRTFFRCFADKEEVCFAEDERLLAVIDETLDGAPDGEPVLDFARRATRARAAHSAADPGRRLAHERLIAATPASTSRPWSTTASPTCPA